METLHVFIHNQLAGVLSQKDRVFSFEYAPEYLASDHPVPLSASLPLASDAQAPDRVKAFFSNLLPEGDLRHLIAKDRKVSADNDFALLREIGGECAGAVSLLPPGEKPQVDADYQLLSDSYLADMIKSASLKPLIIHSDEIRLSLAGAQNKIPVFYENSHCSLPKGTAPSSHILKITSPGFPDLIENEFFCMKLADKAGLSVPQVFIWSHEGVKALIVERYDRFKDDDGVLHRLHQEDFCQALGVMPDRKYENEGGPGYADCVQAINSLCTTPVLEKNKLIDWMVFNFLIGNCDAHAKNISLLYTQAGTTLAPFYDLVSTLIYPELSQKMAMHIGGKGQMNYLFPIHWQRLTDDLEISPKQLSRKMKTMSSLLGALADQVKEEIPADPTFQETASKIMTTIQTQTHRTQSI
ncbi:type II toxin-antitoxin system HipA family toxin [Desulfoluna spongiiphila]|uniref:type II toxin-antitoxin system HipA family toxin n=1 Tax=Desulfoluna spongiiphila TaxID=419481 RepID=UPI0012555D8A|nr:type II toxin-antitoxin system HipA family toxin [Desulfoluna spongiiphila]VVS92225.1 hipa-like c-terminal [Desulfoluna spongiiphila]